MKKTLSVLGGLLAIIIIALILLQRTTPQPSPQIRSSPSFQPTNSALPNPNPNNLLQVPRQSTDQDTSEVDVSVGTNATFLMTDTAGRRTGRDPQTNEQLQEIPASTYFEDRIDDESGQPQINHYAQINRPAQGEYFIVLTGVRDGPYELSVRAFSRNGSAQPPLSKKENIKAGSRVRFVLAFSSSPGLNSTLTTVSEDSGQTVR